jgi:5-methylcytosine-specific restriction endonuclease McrA
MTTTLVLNASFEPLGAVAERRAIVLVLTEKAVVMEEGRGTLHSERLAISVPSVVRLRYYVRVPHQAGSVPLNRKAVFERDGHVCVYCGHRPDTVDHVVPRSRGGLHVWTNVVAACRRCNHRKADRLLSELGWALATPPTMPRDRLLRLRGASAVHDSWARYLDPEGWAEGAAS